MTTEPTKPVKPPACDRCKARRVLCHPRLDGAPCPRCAEKNTVCTTTPIRRGRPKGVPNKTRPPQLGQATSSTTSSGGSRQGSSTKDSDSPSDSIIILRPGSHLDSDFIAQCFEGEFLTPFNHPLIGATSIREDLRAASFQLNLLPPRTRVLALCILTVSSLISFHPSVLGPGRRPKSLGDLDFFSSDAELRACGVRRAAIFHALHAEAGQAAREADVVLEPSHENAASCYLLDLLDRTNLCRLSRPWAGAYISHVRALAPLWRTTTRLGPAEAALWGSFLMAEALTSTEYRLPILITRHDQLLLTGTDAPTLDALLALLTAAEEPGLYLLWPALQPYMFHVTSLARQLYETINGDFARLKPLSEPTVINFLSTLSTLHSILSILLDLVATSIAAIDAALTLMPARGDSPTIDSMARACAVGAVVGFAGLILPFYRELALAERLRTDPRARARMRLFCEQARGFAVDTVHDLARVVRWLPGVQFPPTSYRVLYAWAEFALECQPEDVGDLEAVTTELKLMAYSLDIYADPRVVTLIDRVDAYIAAKSTGGPSSSQAMPDPFDLFMNMSGGQGMDVRDSFDPKQLAELFHAGEYTWLDLQPEGEDGMVGMMPG
ncbi:hypothetical protein B0H16DRAFT_1528271 [Mycena metata]|uniref:Zn(2)-C6 fungal-type domain-containing protein n=1 Tax=Mycena metata TaxID=1033252 RepID=A0AAD7JGI2_9AGAR|nr:hypothetical protein B0H16DRAFT_1528271 [Mycena metata]